MMYKGRWRVTPKSKANAFMQEYATISKLKMDRGTRQERRRVAKHLRGMRTEKGNRETIYCARTEEQLYIAEEW